ncbi:regulator of sigma E protease [Natronospira proteinivora]|uniref:Zinc metalloprotease n=1 Tax=Natronospira proteinivora TaxID=1807133 RepID=A0ABT1G5Q2_9GAMM|nr:RIP metalloprotease RseP [Natronospira proteinivora]MCP1726624.1 regulator of sigma E protease [Natronospira proteinivora]
MSILIAIGGFVLAIGVLVTVHEFGHYLAARLCGVRVLAFSIGFGKPLIRRRAGRDQTQYQLGAIPLGGYVKMLDEREGAVAEGEAHRCFNRQSIPRRATIVLAGPAFNFLFAILAYWAIFVAGIPGIKPIIGEVSSQSPAAEAGLTAEDEILAVNSRQTPTWRSANVELLDGILNDRPIDLRVLRDGQEYELSLSVDPTDRRSLTEPGQLLSGLGLQPWFESLPPVIDELSEDGAARAAGLVSGDRVEAVDGQAVENWRQFREAVAARPGESIDIRVNRDGETRNISLTPRAIEGEEGPEGRIGAGPKVPPELVERMRSEERYGPVAALGMGVMNTAEMSRLTLRMLWRMVNGEVSVKNLSGPINIAHYAGITVSSGLVSFLGFLAIVSISLGIVNLLPIPVLDGGHLVYLGIEAVTRRPVPEHMLAVGQMIGLVMIAGLISFALYNDLMRIFS